MEISDGKWWGTFSLEEGETAERRVKSLQVAIKRMARELLVAHHRFEGEADRTELRFAYSDSELGPSDTLPISRYVFEKTPDQISILPALADRPVVSRPYSMLTVPVDEKATIYVGTPLWFTLAEGDPLEMFFEVPIEQPSDTWFGVNTMEGETCYASRTFARLNIENLRSEPEWATTRVHIVNRSEEPLPIERLKLPVPYLSLFSRPDNRLWTENVTMVKTKGEEMAQFTVEKDPAKLPPDAEQVAEPRREANKGMLISAFSSLTGSAIG